MVTTSCVLNAPRCVTTVPRVHLHGPGEVSSLFTDPPGTPVTPRIYIYINNRSFNVSHTHTHPAFGRVVPRKMRWRLMRMKGEWRWDDHEDEMKKYLARTRRGERKRRRREHQHNTPGPERANPERAREKKSGGSTDTEQDQRRGGRTKAPEPTWHGENLHTPRHATEPTYLRKEERIGDQWGLVGGNTKKKNKTQFLNTQGSCVMPLRARVQVSHKGM